MKYWLLLWALLSLSMAQADSWPPPRITTYYSADSSYFLRVVPTLIPARYAAWRSAPAKKKPRYSPQDTTIVLCHATLFHRIGKDTLRIWHQPLINQIAPGGALVSNNGRYVVTLDNWASLGYGIDVLVVYDAQGALRKRVNLEAVSPYPLNHYRRSVSSLWWRCGQQLADDGTLELCFRDQEDHTLTRRYTLPELATQ